MTQPNMPNCGLAMPEILGEFANTPADAFHDVAKEPEREHEKIGPASDALLILAMMCQKAMKARDAYVTTHNKRVEKGTMTPTEDARDRRQIEAMDAKITFLNAWTLLEALTLYPQIPAGVHACISNTGDVGYIVPGKVTIRIMRIGADSDGSDGELMSDLIDAMRDDIKSRQTKASH